MGKVIAILNYKGGVAKTTTTINLGTALWIMGYRVLLIDADPSQSNLTINMKFEDGENEDTFNEWMCGENQSQPIYIRYDGLDYIPSRQRLKGLDRYLNDARDRERILKKRLQNIKEYYDYILIDCAPKRGVLNDNVMVASDHIIIPTDCGPFSLMGMDTLKEDIEYIQQEMNPDLDLFGILRVKYNKQLINRKKATNILTQMFPDKMLNIYIRICSKADDAPLEFKSIYETAADSTIADDYMRLAEIVTNKRRPKTWKTKASAAFLKMQ